MEKNLSPLLVSGEILEIYNAIQGESWIKQEFILRTDQAYPVLLNFIAFNKVQDQLSRCKVGDTVAVYFNPESRSFETSAKVKKWFTELKAWRIIINFNPKKYQL